MDKKTDNTMRNLEPLKRNFNRKSNAVQTNLNGGHNESDVKKPITQRSKK